MQTPNQATGPSPPPPPQASAEWQYASRLEQAHQAAAALRAFCATLGFDDVGLLRIEHCLYEAFVNAVQHAYQQRPDQVVRVRAEVLDGQLHLAICQFQSPLDAARIAAVPVGFDDLAATLAADELIVNGRGLRIIKASMAGCEVRRDGDWHCLCLRLPLPTAAG